MGTFQSAYTGAEIDAAIGQILSGTDISKMYTTANKTALEGFSGRLTNIQGGYEVSNGYCYIYVKGTVTSAFAGSANDSWAIYDGLPPAEVVTPLNITIADRSYDQNKPDIGQTGGAFIRTSGVIVHRKVTTYNTNMDIIINGMYKIATT